MIERALYNGINSGMSLDGTLYCYRNPLAFDPSTGDKIRNPWYDTTCCPPNLERTFAFVAGIFLQHQQRWNLRPSLRQFGTRLASRKRNRAEGYTEDKLSLGRRSGNHGYTGSSHRISLSTCEFRDGRMSAQVAVNGKDRRRREAGSNTCPFNGNGRRAMSFDCSMEMPPQVSGSESAGCRRYRAGCNSTRSARLLHGSRSINPTESNWLI